MTDVNKNITDVVKEIQNLNETIQKVVDDKIEKVVDEKIKKLDENFEKAIDKKIY